MINYSYYAQADKEKLMKQAAKANQEPRECRQAPGAFMPVINRNACEGKGPCVPACPFDVLEMGVLAKDDRAGLSLRGKIKAFAHGGNQAFVIRPDLCAACGLCVQICPENAISLVRRDARKEAL
jgi:4Fe-4S ferredoxin